MKAQAQYNVSQALNLDQARVQQFPISADLEEAIVQEEQPEMFQGVLKHYQIKGVSWLANLYDQVYKFNNFYQ
jgi:SNF2 family DNA or RNA helicase